MASRRDEGQMILLAGILLVLAFILFSIQLSLLANLGQQAGRETENPLLDDYLLVRRTLSTLFEEELEDATGTVPCGDSGEFYQRLSAVLSLSSAFESSRGSSLIFDDLVVERTGTGPYTYEIGLTIRLTDGVSTVHDEVQYEVDCTGTPNGPAQVP